MSNASLKEQLQAVASHLSDTPIVAKSDKPESREEHKRHHKPSHHHHNNNKKVDKNNQNKPKWLEYAQYGVELLKAYFPHAFKEIQEVKPLKKGIKQDLVKRLGMCDTIIIEDKACMIKSLAYYVNTNSYHKAMKEGAARVDLDGVAIETVTSEEAEYAKERLEGKNKPKDAKKTDLHAVADEPM